MDNYFKNSMSNYLGESDIYNQLSKLQNTTYSLPGYRSVFSDIAEEWNKSSKEEQNFINNDPDYMQANLAYQQAFNSFLLELMGPQFLNSQYGKTAENVLVSMKRAREHYRQKADLTVKNVQEQNEILKAEIAELKKLLE